MTDFSVWVFIMRYLGLNLQLLAEPRFSKTTALFHTISKSKAWAAWFGNVSGIWNQTARLLAVPPLTLASLSPLTTITDHSYHTPAENPLF